MSNTDPLKLEYASTRDGLRVVRQPAPPGAASFSATYVGPGGWGFERRGEEGTARFVNHLITSATQRFDRVELARRLDAAGATLTRQASPESAEVTIWGPAPDWARLLALLAEVVLYPRFDPDDIARIRRQFLERQLREMTQPAPRAEREMLREIFPEGHPYRATGTGVGKSVARLSRATLRKFHRSHYTGDGGLLVITSSARFSALQSRVRAAFPAWPESGPEPLRVPAPPRKKHRQRRVELAGRSQVEIRLGGPSIPQDTPEFPAAFLANEVLGGRPLLSRLFQRVREQNGLAYHASSHLDTMRSGGIWTAQAGTGADRWTRVVPMLEEEVERIRTAPVPRPELNAIRRSAVGEIPLALESTAEAHELAVDVAYHNLPEDYLLQWPERLAEVTPRSAREAASTAFERRGSVTVVVGPLEGRH
ncbi:MAG TPA: pitrilysin family protein [Thermoplasmata archaeon]|nr:pitrilysin family protein [Thermoplasmata archaeon]